jgi:response regulator NasT
MNRALRVVVADDERRLRDYYRKVLPRLCHMVVAAAETGRQLVEQCRTLHPDLVITDVKMPDLDGIDAVTEIFRQDPVPVIVVSAYHDPELLERASAACVLAYLVKPIKRADLEAAVALAIRRFEQFEAVRREAADLRQALEDCQLVERAKRALRQFMGPVGMDEEEAYRWLRKVAGDRNRRLADVARNVLIAETVSRARNEPQQN